MIPSVDTRLASMASSLTGVIGPALAGTNPFAEEQAALLVGHLQVLRGHQPVTDEFERLEHNRTRAFARDLLAAVDGGERVRAASAALRGWLEGPVPFTMTTLRHAQDELTAAIAALIDADGVDGTAASVAASTAVVLAYERPHSLRLRAYYAAMGYESGSTEVPAIDAMMTEFRAGYGPTAATG
jgi:hypothetical protein